MSGLVLKGISKSFGGTRAVDRVNLTFAEGQLTALLGPSGCGKTTLLRMIAGLEAPSSGSLMLGGRDITGLPAHKRKFGMVFQSFALFPHLSVRDNVAYSLHISGASRTEAAETAKRLLDLVQLSAFGDRRIGELSGGQRQRVAIARAILKDAPILLLDEATSALDANSEARVQEALDKLSQGRTTIVIAHRLATVRKADRIYVMKAGEIVESGDHDSLIQENGLYAQLSALQFADG